MPKNKNNWRYQNANRNLPAQAGTKNKGVRIAGAGTNHGADHPNPADRVAPLPKSSIRYPRGPGHAGHGGQRKAERRGGPGHRQAKSRGRL